MLKPYYKPPKDTCEACGTTLYGKARYKIKLYLKSKTYKNVVFKELVVCSKCLREILANETLKEQFKIKYRKMRMLGILH